MIRLFKENDIEEIMDIWLKTNIEAHGYIKASYWKSKYEEVKDAMLSSQIYVYLSNGEIVGFIGLIDSYIAGLFVKKEYQGRGIGRRLIEYSKKGKSTLSLEVYANNILAIDFYKSEDFYTVETDVDSETNQIEYFMKWSETL